MKVQLVSVEGFARLSGVDENGVSWLQFSNQINEEGISESLMTLEDCPKCGESVKDQEDMGFCDHCGEDLFEACRPECAECGNLIYDGWQCMDGFSDDLCDECVLMPDEEKHGITHIVL